MLVRALAHAPTLEWTSLPYERDEALRMLLVFWILLGKEFKHDPLLLVHAQSEHDGDQDEHADTDDRADQRATKRRKHDAGIDRVSHVGIGAAHHKLVMLFHSRTRT